jgi:hypothetical protein
MRFFVLLYSDYQDIVPHIIAEVVHEQLDDDRKTTIASALAGDRAVIMTRAELLADRAGETALAAWDARDDSVFDDESDAIRDDTGLHGIGGGRSPRRLRPVPDPDPETSGAAEEGG